MKITISTSCIFMILGISVFTDVVFSKYFSKYGCKYLNSQYEKDRSPSGWMSFGIEMPAYSFSDYSKLIRFYTRTAAPINNDVIEQYLQNNIDSFIQIHSDYRKQSRPFKTFYRNYQVKYIPGTTGGSVAIEIMDRITRQKNKIEQRNSKIDKSFYLAVSFSLRSKVTYDEINHESSINRIPEEKYSFHVVGLLRFNVADRYGYVVFDPHSQVLPPQIIMDDGALPYEGYELRVNTMQYKVFPRNKNYIYSYWYAGNIEQDSVVHDHTIIRFIIYAGLSYCSFLETTEKYYHVIRHQKDLNKINDAGVCLGGLYTILGETIMVDPETSELIKTNVTNSNIILFLNNPEGNILFRDYISSNDIINHVTWNKTLNERAQNAIHAVSELFQWEYSRLLMQLKKIADVLGDNDFIFDVVTTDVMDILPN